MIKVLFICLGNICRSPLAEAIFNHKVKEKGLDGKISSDSCGTSDFHIGEYPDERSLHCAKTRGIFINHRGRQLSRPDLKDFDYLIAMDQYNFEQVKNLMDANGIRHNHLYLMREFQPDAEHLDVPDPFFGEQESFEEVFDILDESMDHLLNKVIRDHLNDA